MNHKDDITPEEKLLHLIRGSNKKASKPEPKSERKVSQSKEAKIVFTGAKSLNFALINKLILLAVFIALLLFLFDLYFGAPEISRPLATSKAKPKSISLEEKEIKSISYYQQEISKRNLFKAGASKPKSKKVIPAGPTFRDLVKNLHLLGIVSGDNPQVIIEDRKLNKTYFLYTGDYLGDIKVEEIHSDSVLLEYKGEKVSLFL